MPCEKKILQTKNHPCSKTSKFSVIIKRVIHAHYGKEGGASSVGLSVCLSVCLSPTHTLDFHSPEGATDSHDTTVSCYGRGLSSRPIGVIHLF